MAKVKDAEGNRRQHHGGAQDHEESEETLTNRLQKGDAGNPEGSL